MNVLMTVVSLAIIEKAGRKTLMLIGLVGMMFDVILLTVCLALKVTTTCDFRRKILD
jgi:SP family facilitated glucose transporter-like MFS transporter 1